MAERVAANPQIMRRRKAIIEHCFGTIKRSLGYDYFLCRGMSHVATRSQPRRARLQPKARLQSGGSQQAHCSSELEITPRPVLLPADRPWPRLDVSRSFAMLLYDF